MKKMKDPGKGAIVKAKADKAMKAMEFSKLPDGKKKAINKAIQKTQYYYRKPK